MRNLMKFGMVLVVLTMVTSVAFATETWDCDDDFGSWCDEDNWDNNMPRDGRKDDVRIRNGNTVVIDCEPAMIGTLEIRKGGCQVGTATFRVDELYVDDDLEMSDDKTSDYSTLNIVNGNVFIEDKSEDVFEDGSGEISIAAGSSLVFDDGVYFGDSNGDGCDDTYTLDIAGDFLVADSRLEHRGGHLIVNLTGDGTFTVVETTRLSSKDDAMATINITDDATYNTDKLELGERGSGADCDYSVAINLSGNGAWDGGGEEFKDQNEGQILNIDITGNGSFLTKKLEINDDDSEIHITMDSGQFNVEDDLKMNAGDIVITGGEFNVEDDFKLGDDGVATITVSGTAEVWIDDLYMADEAELTIIGCRVDLDDLKEMGSDSVIDILIGGSLVIKNADDEDDWEEIEEWIDDEQIITSGPGEIIWDYGDTNSDRLTIQVVYPFEVDLKPGGCPNPLRIGISGQGVFPVAIVGSATFDVTTINLDTITLIGVPVHRAKVGDVGGGGCEDLGPDGTNDLVLKFKREKVITALEDLYGDLTIIPNRTPLRLVLFAETIGGDPVGGVDTLVVLNRGGIKTKKKVGGSKK